MFEEENLDFLDLRQDDNIEKFLIYLLENYLNLDQQQKFDYFKKIPKEKLTMWPSPALGLVCKILIQEEKVNPKYSFAYNSKWNSFLLDFWCVHKEICLKAIYVYNDKLRNKKLKINVCNK